MASLIAAAIALAPTAEASWRSVIELEPGGDAAASARAYLAQAAELAAEETQAQ